MVKIQNDKYYTPKNLAKQLIEKTITVLVNNGSKNDILFDWSQKYIVHHLNYTYNNCNYHRKNKGSNDSDEVLITNY